MPSNLDRFKADLAKLLAEGKKLFMAMQYDALPEETREAVEKHVKGDKKKADEYFAELPSFKGSYQGWYSEGIALLRQVLPSRLADFIRHYEIPKTRKELTYSTYTIEDFLQGTRVTRGFDQTVVVGSTAAIPHFTQQQAILEAASRTFESSLFDIKQMLQADLLDSEVEAAEHLLKFKFARAAGALAGVVLERHLSQVCENRQVSITKKNPTIADYNEALKAAGFIDVPQWRYVQHLADIRNLCDHSKSKEPTAAQVEDLVSGVKKTTKDLY